MAEFIEHLDQYDRRCFLHQRRVAQQQPRSSLLYFSYTHSAGGDQQADHRQGRSAPDAPAPAPRRPRRSNKSRIGTSGQTVDWRKVNWLICSLVLALSQTFYILHSTFYIILSTIQKSIDTCTFFGLHGCTGGRLYTHFDHR